MSFERFLSSDVYIFEHAGGFIQCCGCNLVKPDEDEIFGFAELATPRLALEHLDLHEAAGDDIGGARRRIEKEYPDLDITIKPYVTPPEVREQFREMLRKAQENSE
jgi:hypothetical protein